MTNEEIVIQIQQGHTDLYLELWNNINRLIYKFSYKFYTLYRDKCIINGITQDDLYQTGYIAMANAVPDYKPEKGYQFLTYLNLHYKTCFMEMIGRRTSRRDILELCSSIDVPISEDNEATIGDILEDPINQTESTEERIFKEQLHNAVTDCLAELPDNQRDVIIGKYYNNLSLAEIGRNYNICRERARQLESQALRKLRIGNNIRRIKPFADEIFSRALYNTGFNSFANKQASSVELTTEWINRI